MQAITRISTSIPFAAMVTFALFFLMQMLIGNTPTLVPTEDFRKQVPIITEVEPIDPFEPVVSTRPLETDSPEEALIDTVWVPEDEVIIMPEAPPVPGGAIVKTSGLENSNVFLILGMAPMYPPTAQIRGKEGFALVEFTVGADGKVTNPVLIKETPEGFGFGRAALRAILDFQFKARMVDGQALATTGIRERFIFELED